MNNLPDMTIAVDWDVKHQAKQKTKTHLAGRQIFFKIGGLK